MEQVNTTGICANCGAGDGLHQYETGLCPLYGREETNPCKPQRWGTTTFQDKGLLDFQNEAVNNYKTLQAQNEGLRKDIEGLMKEKQTLLAEKDELIKQVGRVQYEIQNKLYEGIVKASNVDYKTVLGRVSDKLEAILKTFKTL